MGVMGPICHLARVISVIRMPCEGMHVLLGCLVKACCRWSLPSIHFSPLPLEMDLHVILSGLPWLGIL